MNSYSSISFLFDFSVIPSIKLWKVLIMNKQYWWSFEWPFVCTLCPVGLFLQVKLGKGRAKRRNECNSLSFAFKALVRISNSVTYTLPNNHSNDLTKTFWANLHLKFIAIYRQKLTVLWCQNSFGVRLRLCIGALLVGHSMLSRI